MPSPEAAVECDGLVRRFGERAALAGVDLHVAEGEFVLVTGPNGAGKTTLLRVLATVLRPSEGAVSVGGHELPRAADKARPWIGYVAHGPLTYPGLTARENLELYAALYGVSDDLVGPALDRVGLDDRGRDPVSEFSRGMAQRLALARACLHGPSLLLLDEPTAGLDADGRDLLREVLAEPGRTVIVSTHEPAWFEGLATSQVPIRAGRVAA
ncbi:MAG TPA: heme ABC exporter ATP-binding protein CcmA [Gaiellales bacterium]|jgi:heme ABC exporter ATP-binding subunit CcmA|nr:heme ABC exporter ATP-binding protein CcmA [Gaiellales bacterium]